MMTKTKNLTRPQRSTRTPSTSSSSSDDVIPKTFTASQPRRSSLNSNTTPQIKTFTNRVNCKAIRVAAPPKFLQRSGGKQVKPVKEKEETSTSSLRRHHHQLKKSTEVKHHHTSIFAASRNKEDLSHTASESDEQPEDLANHSNNTEQEDETTSSQNKKEKPKVRRHDPLVYRSKNCTFNQDYLNLLTFEPNMEELTILSDDEEEKEETPKTPPRSRNFKPYVKKEQTSGFGFWSSGLEDSLLAGSGFSYKPTVAKKKPLPKRTQMEGEKKNVLPPTVASTSAFLF